MSLLPWEARLLRRISSAEKNCVGGWSRGVGREDNIESWGALEEYPVSVDIIVFRKGEGM